MSLLIYNDFLEKYKDQKPFPKSNRSSDIMGAYSGKPNSTMDIHRVLSSLYEEKLVSYVRTHSRKMSLEHFDLRFNVLDAIAHSNYENREIRQLILSIDLDYINPKIWIKDYKQPHQPLTPTTEIHDIKHYFNVNIRPYDDVRREIYLDICKSYIKLFIPD